MTAVEGYVGRRVLDALLRENYAGLAGRVTGDRLRLNGHAIELCRDGFLADVRVANDIPIDDVLGLVAQIADPRDDVAALERECRETVAAIRLHHEHRDAVFARLGPPRRGDGTWFDTLAAHTDHPVYPTARCRLGLSEADLCAYAPEFHPSFALEWTGVPADRVVRLGERPPWWPTARDAGLPDDHDVFPVHPLSAAPRVPGPRINVRPTLSMRTVAVDAQTHLKLPLPTATLGYRNVRSIKSATLVDGARVQAVLSKIAAETGLPVILADEQTYGHAGDPNLAYLVRRLPDDVRDAYVVPVAALLADDPAGRPVISLLSDDVEGFFTDYLDILFGWNVALFVRGIALEAHQQNVSIVTEGGRSLRLMIKDNDGALMRPEAAPAPEDRRMLTTDPDALARVFITITLHLCAGAIAVGLAERNLVPHAMELVADRLERALAAHDAAFLWSRTLNAERLPTKAMVTAGTLVGKDRTGAADINKHYGPPGPNYLRIGAA